jgi:SAM-dependent methyltransferase
VPDLAQAYLAQSRRRGLEHWSGPPAMVDRIAKTLRTEPEHVVLDVGCGVGGPARRLAGVVGCRVVGVDVLPELVREAMRRKAVGVRFLAGAADALPVRSTAVDQVWSLGVAAHVPALRRMASEFCRVLVPGGSVAITEAFWEGRGLPRFTRTAPSPWRPLTLSGLMSTLTAAGFREVRQLPWPGYGIAGALHTNNAELDQDLRDGRLVPALVVATR